MENFLQQLLNGLSLGGIYALIALGYTMVYGVLKLINFAHGDLFTIGSYIGFTLLVSFGLANVAGPIGALIAICAVVMLSVAFLGVCLERAAYRPLRHSPRLSAVVSALGASIFLQNAVMLIYGAKFHVYPQGLIARSSLSLFGLYLPLVKVFVLLVSLLVMALLYIFIQKTLTGAAIRAVAIDHRAAQLVGINVDRVVTLVFLIGPALGGLAGLMVGLLYGQITFTMGWLYGLKAFTAAILGGIGNIPGAMLGGIILGIIESMSSAYLSVAWKDAVTFFVLILILTVRPTGILGERVAEKV
ncbi:MAG: branched-chain amino acid ABC transporter permease [Thermodesulforhabdaceae bacterium]